MTTNSWNGLLRDLENVLANAEAASDDVLRAGRLAMAAEVATLVASQLHRAASIELRGVISELRGDLAEARAAA